MFGKLIPQNPSARLFVGFFTAFTAIGVASTIGSVLADRIFSGH